MSDVSDWWSTEIIEMEPGSISLRGMPIENLIGEKSFTEMIWFMTTGNKLNKKNHTYLRPLWLQLLTMDRRHPQ